MLAIKLHDERRPYLGVGSHLMPFIDEMQGRQVLGQWARTLIRGKWLARDCYISLVKIRDDVWVFLSADRDLTKVAYGLHPKAPAFKARLMELAKPLRRWNKNELTEFHSWPTDAWEPLKLGEERGRPNMRLSFKCMWPEFILAEALPQSAVKWTKRFRLWRRRG